MRGIWPESPDSPGSSELTDHDLERIYGYPGGLTGAWVQANLVTSADGAVSVGNLSAGLSHPADRRIFLLGRDLADAVLVGAGTAAAEDYRGVRAGARRLARRRALGLRAVPPIVVVSRNLTLDPGARLFTDTAVPPIVVTTEQATSERATSEQATALRAAGAELITAGEREVDLALMLDLLAARGLRRIDCEGGPVLLGSLIAADLVDQLCLTVAPLLAGAGADRIVAGPAVPAPRGLALASVLHEEGYLLLRYRRAPERTGAG